MATESSAASAVTRPSRTTRAPTRSRYSGAAARTNRPSANAWKRMGRAWKPTCESATARVVCASLASAVSRINPTITWWRARVGMRRSSARTAAVKSAGRRRRNRFLCSAGSSRASAAKSSRHAATWGRVSPGARRVGARSPCHAVRSALAATIAVSTVSLPLSPRKGEPERGARAGARSSRRPLDRAKARERCTSPRRAAPRLAPRAPGWRGGNRPRPSPPRWGEHHRLTPRGRGLASGGTARVPAPVVA